MKYKHFHPNVRLGRSLPPNNTVWDGVVIYSHVSLRHAPFAVRILHTTLVMWLALKYWSTSPYSWLPLWVSIYNTVYMILPTTITMWPWFWLVEFYDTRWLNHMSLGDYEPYFIPFQYTVLLKIAHYCNLAVAICCTILRHVGERTQFNHVFACHLISALSDFQMVRCGDTNRCDPTPPCISDLCLGGVVGWVGRINVG